MTFAEANISLLKQAIKRAFILFLMETMINLGAPELR